MTNANTIQQRLQDLLSTTPNLTSDEISAVNDACSLIDELTTERDEYKQRMQRLMRSQFEITKERDALQVKLDISRRKLTELSKAEALENLYQLAMGQEREIVKLEKERDALTMATKLALHELEWWLENYACKATQKAIEALKKAGVTP